MSRSPSAVLLTVALTGLSLGSADALRAQTPALDAEDPIAAAEAHGRDYPAPEVVWSLPELWKREPDGTSERLCVDLPSGPTMTRSGEFVIGGIEMPIEAGRQHKIWWKPINSTLEMTADFATYPLDGGDGEIEFDVRFTTHYTNDTPPQKIPEEAFFPSATTFPSPGRWMVVVTSAENWGCFVFHVEPATDGSWGRG